ncbi:MAG TPA: hypothetical protein VN732_00990 [Solirubrobacterales bacterium]|nr:hypothetical protein [Solirubrobacterales bacterium]
MKRITRKPTLVAIGCIAALAVAAVAYAYFTSTGSGTATAKVGTSSAVTLKGTVTGNLYPGASSQVSFTVDNPSSGTQRVGTITLTGITVDAGHSTCSATIGGATPDFSMPAVAVNATFGPGNGQAVTPKGTLTMNDTGVNQNACQGAELTLALASN